VRPLLAAGGHPAVWVTERCGRVSVRGLDRAFEEAREAAGLPGELDLHALRHSYVTHLVEFDYPERFVQDQVGHAYASTTAIYTNSRELHQTGEKPQAAMSARRSCMFPGTFGMAA
jgi:site-specific recombinase XerD